MFEIVRASACARPTKAAALLGLVLAGCGEEPTTLLLEIDGPAALTSIDIMLAVGSGSVSRHIPLGQGSMKLPGTVLVQLPDRALDVAVDVAGMGDTTPLTAHAQVVSRPHEQVRVPLALGDRSDGDLGADLGTGVDLADLSASSDLKAASDSDTHQKK